MTAYDLQQWFFFRCFCRVYLCSPKCIGEITSLFAFSQIKARENYRTPTTIPRNLGIIFNFFFRFSRQLSSLNGAKSKENKAKHKENQINYRQ